jgi:predicted nucleic-acid-binding protein
VVLDEPGQVEQAKRLMSENTCYITCSVVREVVWVLAKTYRFAKDQILIVLDSLIQSEQIVLENEVAIMQAVSWYRQGCDFADALHLASSNDCTSLATFDQAFIKAAAATRLTSIPVTYP